MPPPPPSRAPSPSLRELQLDGLIGPSHSFAGLAPGNLASAAHAGASSNPRAAARAGLAKMRLVRALGVAQGVLPPQERPHLPTLRRLGYAGRDEEIVAAAAADDPALVLAVSSAASMWTANAATCTPSCDAADGRVHLTVANLQAMFHRSIEAETTGALLGALFSDRSRFLVHPPLPAGGGRFDDEGAANHLRLHGPGGAVHLFAWGRSASSPGGTRLPARQTLEASRAVARRHRLAPERCLFPRQSAKGIDAGAFHSDVLAVSCEEVVLVHEHAFDDLPGVLEAARSRVGSLVAVVAKDAELPLSVAVASYPFNSQLLALPDGDLALVAPVEAREAPAARAFLERARAEVPRIRRVEHVDLRESMQNGGGPACLRLRAPLCDDELDALAPGLVLDEARLAALEAWVDRHHRDRLRLDDLCDPAFAREQMEALDRLTDLLGLGALYSFQRTGGASPPC